MKLLPLIFLLLSGCAANSNPIAEGPLGIQPMLVTPPAALTLVWNPGSFTNDLSFTGDAAQNHCLFVVVASRELSGTPAQWPVFTVTTATNFQVVPDGAQQFFSMFGSNTVTGDNLWVVK